MSHISTLEFAEKLARQAGDIIKDHFYKSKVIDTKESDADLVTETDKLVEDTIRGCIAAEYPDHKFIAEESVSDGEHCELTDSPTWLVDPIDGTSNFINRFPMCCVSIGFYINKEAEVGVVYNPILDQLYSARKGHGAFLNGKKITVSTSKRLLDSLVLTDWGGDRTETNLDCKMRNMSRVIRKARGIRTMGSAAMHLCQVAAGSGDAFYEFGIHCWDYAAGVLMVREAGGVCCSVDGSPVDLMARHVICAATDELLNELRPLIEPVVYSRD